MLINFLIFIRTHIYRNNINDTWATHSFVYVSLTDQIISGFLDSDWALVLMKFFFSVNQPGRVVDIIAESFAKLIFKQDGIFYKSISMFYLFLVRKNWKLTNANTKQNNVLHWQCVRFNIILISNKSYYIELIRFSWYLMDVMKVWSSYNTNYIPIFILESKIKIKLLSLRPADIVKII